eukprot:scaffold11698_cov138-Cylindrotheca_fusiformis.AAC.8
MPFVTVAVIVLGESSLLSLVSVHCAVASDSGGEWVQLDRRNDKSVGTGFDDIFQERQLFPQQKRSVIKTRR